MNSRPSEEQHKHAAIVVMGVSGSGKSTVGLKLAKLLGWEFIEGDSFHSAANIAKMSAGIALTDSDRLPWLARIAEALRIQVESGKGAVVACSALKEQYRAVLREVPVNVSFIWLDGTKELIASRIARRTHFMSSALLQSQFDTLEPPANALRVSIDASPDEIAAHIIAALHLGSFASSQVSCDA